MSACPLTIHGLLHVCQDIRFCGPSWTTWTFFMERYCGFLKCGLRSKRFPWANLNNRVLNYSYMEQIGVRYNLSEELAIFGLRSSGPSKAEHVYEHCESIASSWRRFMFWSVDPHAILRVPYQKTHAPDDDIQQKIARFFSNVLGRPINQFTPLLPKIMPRWGKVRIVDGDKIKAATTSVRGENSDRNTSYVRVSISDTLTSVLTFL